MICGLASGVHGAEPCPRQRGHQGRHLWWIPWEQGRAWRVVVYSGAPKDRVRCYRGSFIARPNGADVMFLIAKVEAAKKRERAAAMLRISGDAAQCPADQARAVSGAPVVKPPSRATVPPESLASRQARSMARSLDG